METNNQVEDKLTNIEDVTFDHTYKVSIQVEQNKQGKLFIRSQFPVQDKIFTGMANRQKALLEV